MSRKDGTARISLGALEHQKKEYLRRAEHAHRARLFESEIYLCGEADALEALAMAWRKKHTRRGRYYGHRR